MNCNAKRQPALKYTILYCKHLTTIYNELNIFRMQWTAPNYTSLQYNSAVDHIGWTGDPQKGRGAAAAPGKKEEFICSASLQST